MEELEKILLDAAPKEKLPCVMAFKIAREHEFTLNEIGEKCNELGIKIVNCQLGCF